MDAEAQQYGRVTPLNTLGEEARPAGSTEHERERPAHQGGPSDAQQPITSRLKEVTLRQVPVDTDRRSNRFSHHGGFEQGVGQLRDPVGVSGPGLGGEEWT